MFFFIFVFAISTRRKFHHYSSRPASADVQRISYRSQETVSLRDSSLSLSLGYFLGQNAAGSLGRSFHGVGTTYCTLKLGSPHIQMQVSQGSDATHLSRLARQFQAKVSFQNKKAMPICATPRSHGEVLLNTPALSTCPASSVLFSMEYLRHILSNGLLSLYHFRG